MIWQDLVIMIASVMFSYALIPQVYKDFKSKKASVTIQTSLITTVGMAALCIVYLSLNLFFTCITSIIITSLWATLLIQGIIYKPN